MKTFQARMISQSDGGRKAMVTVVLEVAGKKISSTRHVVRSKNGLGWVGFNPDPRAVAANEETERQMQLSEIVLSRAVAKLEKLEEVAKQPNNPASIFAPAAITLMAAMIENLKTNFAAACKRDGEVKSEYPLVVAFNIG